MVSKTLLKPCCARFSKLALEYQDLTASDDYQLRALSNLLLCITDMEIFEVETLHEVARLIDAFLDRKLVREHYLFGRTVKGSAISAIELGAEIHRVHSKLKEAGVV
jgi:hypothetical protein